MSGQSRHQTATVHAPSRAARSDALGSGRAGAGLPAAALRLAALQQGLGNRAVQSRLAGCSALAACPTGGACHACPFRGPSTSSSARIGLQPKLVVGPPGDRFEQEADRVAARIVDGPIAGAESIQPSPRATLQRACADCGPDDEQRVQRAPAATDTLQSSEGPARDATSPSPRTGRPLSPASRAYFEPRFGRDFSAVRVHADPTAGASARAVRAHAYTVGHDIAFAAGQYAPETAEGRRLLAHELTHVVQQAGGAVRLQRQPANQSTTTVSPGPLPTLPSWGGCDPGLHATLDAELGDAIEWVERAIADLKRPTRPLRTTGALRRYLTPDDTAVTDTILPKLELMRDELRLGPANFRCQTEAQCRAVHPGGADAYAGHPVTLCPDYFDQGRIDRVTDLVHEVGHNAGLRGNVIEWQWPFAGMSEAQRLGNTESYAAFVRNNRYPMMPPEQQDVGFSLGVGRSFGPGDARWAVSFEVEGRVRGRVLRLFDLHAGVRFDVDMGGRVLASASLGPRIFSPIAPGRTRLFLDLRAGGAAGAPLTSSAGGTWSDMATDLRIGLGGNINASVGWQRVWKLFTDNPTIDTVFIRGEFRL